MGKFRVKKRLAVGQVCFYYLQRLYEKYKEMQYFFYMKNFDFNHKIDTLYVIFIHCYDTYIYRGHSYVFRDTLLCGYIFSYGTGILYSTSSFGTCHDSSRLDCCKLITRSISCYSCRRCRLRRWGNRELFYPRAMDRETFSHEVWEIYPHHS